MQAVIALLFAAVAILLLRSVRPDRRGSLGDSLLTEMTEE